jgi:hypothetical protein
MLYKRLILAIIFIIGCLPILISPIPVHATTMANNTATANFSIRQNISNGTWSQGTFNYVGCVNGSNDTKYGIGIYFAAVPIPQGAAINSAYLVVTSSGTYTQDTVNSVIIGQDADTALVFTTVANYQARRGTVVGGATNSNITTAYVSWNGISHWTAGTQYPSPDISAVIEEIVNRAGWVSGNNMVLFWDDHAPSSSQGSYVPPIVRGGSSYILMVDYTTATAVTYANITTKDATDVGSGSAILNAYIDDDGDDPNNVALRFGFDNATHAANFAAYTNFTAWSTSNYSTGTAYSLAISSLLPSTTYYFNTQGQNSAGLVYGIEQTFVTPAVSTTVSPSNFVILPSTDSVDLRWTKPSGYSESRLYFKVGSIPTSNTTGELIYSGLNTDYSHTGLTSGTTYGYLLYGYEGGAWSLTTSGTTTTKGTSAGTGLPSLSAPIGWFVNVNYQTQNQTFIYPIVNNLADSFSMPRDTAWVTWALAVSMFFGFLVWSASRSMLISSFAVCGGIILGSAQGLLPKAMILLVLIFAISIISIRERV